jgi:TetR/AcrR family transcriptional regulator, transcriptional repressor of aconitase
MAAIRLEREVRRKAIVDAAMPLFARNGFGGTTTKQIAAAAGVSEALLFKHFPTKSELYQAMLRSGCSADPAFARLETLEPSTRTLVQMMRFMVRHVVIGAVDSPAACEARTRLMVSSFLEDGAFARLAFEAVASALGPRFAASIAAAERAGDLAPRATPPLNLLWFAHHVAATLAHARLPGGTVVPYDGATEAVLGQAVRFILRGIGLTDAAIAAHDEPAALSSSAACP